MTLLTTFTLIFNALLMLSLFLRHLKLEKKVTRMQQLDNNLKSVTGPDEPTDLKYRMVIELKEPLALAARESKLAGLAQKSAPDLIIRKVYDILVQKTRSQMKAEQINASVKLEVF